MVMDVHTVQPFRLILSMRQVGGRLMPSHSPLDGACHEGPGHTSKRVMNTISERGQYGVPMQAFCRFYGGLGFPKKVEKEHRKQDLGK